MEKILLPIIGSLLACLGVLAIVVFNQEVLGIVCICIGVVFQIVNIFFIIRYLKAKRKAIQPNE